MDRDDGVRSSVKTIDDRLELFAQKPSAVWTMQVEPSTIAATRLNADASSTGDEVQRDSVAQLGPLDACVNDRC